MICVKSTLPDRKGRNVAVAIDPQGKLHYGEDNVSGNHAIAILGEQVYDEYLSELREDVPLQFQSPSHSPPWLRLRRQPAG